MANLVEHIISDRANPLDLVEQLVADHEWPFERQGDDDLTVGLGGNFCEFQLWFSWRADLGALALSCAFDLKAPLSRQKDLAHLLILINERLPVGHFDLWRNESMVVWRHAQLVRGSATVSSEQIQDLVVLDLNECERFFPAFQFLMWGGKSAEDAMAAAILETAGEA